MAHPSYHYFGKLSTGSEERSDEELQERSSGARVFRFLEGLGMTVCGLLQFTSSTLTSYGRDETLDGLGLIQAGLNLAISTKPCSSSDHANRADSTTRPFSTPTTSCCTGYAGPSPQGLVATLRSMSDM